MRDLDFTIHRNETLAIVGESGSGKSTTALTLLGLQSRSARITGSARFRDTELIGQSEMVMRGVRGSGISYVPQNPFASLNPAMRIGVQIAESIRVHEPRLQPAEYRERAIELLAVVGIDNPATRVEAYPHQLSGGMRQRVVIAMALASRPSLIIADEPTSALDVTVQAQVLEALEDIREISQASLLLITHDLGVVARMADRIMVMYAGACVESGDVADVLSRPRMPYTKGLLGAIPQLHSRSGALARVPQADGGSFPDHGCRFAPRCPAATAVCVTEEPSSEPVRTTGEGSEHRAACLRLDDVGEQDALEIFPAMPHDDSGPKDAVRRQPVLSVRNLVKHFTASAAKQGFWPSKTSVHAVCDVSFELRPGETLAIVGESGSGKSTLMRTLMRLETPTRGSIELSGRDITALAPRRMRPLRARLQMVMQDSTAALNPKLTVATLLAEPVRLHGGDPDSRVPELLTLVGLPHAVGQRFPSELSGGQRQRVAIARALAVKPEVLVLDEPTSALDVSIQAEILTLLRQLQDEFDLAYIFVTHDLGVVRHIADRVAVMYLGRIVEEGPVDDVLSTPQHPYTEALISAVPVTDVDEERSRTRIVLRGEVPSASSPPSGCRFRTRCPLFLSLPEQKQVACKTQRPLLDTTSGADRTSACHFSGESNIDPLLFGSGAEENHNHSKRAQDC
ncbi:MAG: dipeptide ABC transporter ATP-binding protein [Microbacterium sp.]